jgi:dTDP-glucose 4,6-dehydratase
VIPTIITQALNGSEIRLGNLEPTRDLNYVADTVEGFIKAAETPQAIGETINLGSGREISIRDLAALILKLMNRDIPIALEDARLRPENSEVDRLCADSRKGQSILGWTPKYSLEDGLAATVEWIRENSERYRTDIYVV